MSWLKALESVCGRAAARPPRRTSLLESAVARRLAPATSRNALQQQQQQPPLVAEVGPSTAALHRVSSTWSSSLAVIQFSQPDSSCGLTWKMHRLPLQLAAQCVAILLEAGQSATALDVLRCWQPPAVKPRIRAKLHATVKLKKALETLSVIGDVETLRTVISVLHQSVMEQHQKRRSRVSCSSADVATRSSESEEVGEESYRFFSTLGARRTRVLFVEAVHELLLQDESVVPLHEKLTWINAATVATRSKKSGTQVPYLIPFILQDDFRSVIEQSPSYDEGLLQQVGPAFASGFLHPTQCSPLDILCTPRSELKRLHKKGLDPSGELWAEMKHLVGATSPAVQQGSQIVALIDAVCRADATYNLRSGRHRSYPVLTEEQRLLRRHFVSQLRSPRSSTRREWSRALLRHPRLLLRLGLSPLMVFRVCALTFRSFRVHTPFARCCMPLLRQLRRVGRDEDAARLVWNHLSVVDPKLAALFAARPLALDDAVAVVCLTMRRGVRGRRDPWMGHRSLAVLRVAAAADLLTPAHCVPTCAAALDCGVHFATVQQIIGEVFGSDSDTARWVLNMVRLTADSHATRLLVPMENLSHTAVMRSLLRRYAYEAATVGSSPSVEVCVPSRSKLLALWTMVNDDVMSVSLRRLICRLFLDEEAQMTVEDMNEMRQPIQHVVNSLFREEILASVAANCTTTNSYLIIMNALDSRRRLRNTQRCAQLLLSEVDDESVEVLLPTAG
ncbi:hypothetical protein DQ04_02941040 [Trypanosoma grayi]|uniref:hypothetical protein n=1 Tax=Trypanosoma grayi TaxID=71804 RepID=UPI0004F4354D|nr:hypothetical protein DQ04_02941040 [Trypanosoma grayi]KEG11141.1 hypothetical protein DQ04_02941040 [Trypanosoma grayi]